MPLLTQLPTILQIIAMAWAPSGVKVTERFGAVPVSAHDASGGVYIQWMDQRNAMTNYADVYGIRLGSDGAVAQGWPSTGLVLSGTSLQEARSLVVSTDSSSASWLYTVYRRNNEPTKDLFIKRTIANGVLDPAWPDTGIALEQSPLDLRTIMMVADGTGGTLVSWVEQIESRLTLSPRTARAQRILANGSFAPGWPATGLVLATSDQGGPYLSAVVPDGTGGGFFLRIQAGDITDGPTLVQHILADGSNAPGWPPTGARVASIASFQGTTHALSDGAGGLYVVWQDYRGGQTGDEGDVYMQRLGPDGLRVTGWPEDGLPLHVGPDAQWSPTMCPDGAGGVLVSWYEYGSGRLWLTRVTPSGALSPGWTPGGTLVCTASGFGNAPSIAADAAGGAYLAWIQDQPSSRAYCQHFRGNGMLAPGWAMTGTLLVDIALSGQDDVSIVPSDPGAAIVVWSDQRSGEYPSIRAQKLVTDGLVPVQMALRSVEADPGRVRLTWWGADASAMQWRVERSDDGQQWRVLGVPARESDGGLVYDDSTVLPGARHAYRLVDTSDRVVVAATWVDVPQRAEFALRGATPNPARLGALTVQLSLARQGPGTLELLDLAGRRVAWRDLGGLAAGRHTLPMPETATLAPGMHWLRMSQEGRVATARVVLVR